MQFPSLISTPSVLLQLKIPQVTWLSHTPSPPIKGTLFLLPLLPSYCFYHIHILILYRSIIVIYKSFPHFVHVIWRKKHHGMHIASKTSLHFGSSRSINHQMVRFFEEWVRLVGVKPAISLRISFVVCLFISWIYGHIENLSFIIIYSA